MQSKMMQAADEAVVTREDVSRECTSSYVSDRNDKGKRSKGMKLFTFNICVLLFLMIAGHSYFKGTVRMLEKQYGLSSTDTGFLVGADSITAVPMLLIYGYLGDKFNKAKIIGFSAVILSVSCVTHALPYFIYNSRPESAINLSGMNYSNDNASELVVKSKDVMCMKKTRNDTCGVSVPTSNVIQGVYVIFAISRILYGLGDSPFFPLGHACLYDSLGKIQASTYIGILTSMVPLGSFAGHMSSGITASVPIDLSDYSLPPSDPRFLGAWWLGFLVLAAGLLVFSVPMFLFPPTFAKNRTQTEKRTSVKKFICHPKEIAGSMRTLASRPVYLIFVIVNWLLVLAGSALFSNLNRYLEVHFRVPVYKANMIKGATTSLFRLIIPIIGGCMITRLRMSTRGIVRMIFILIVIYAAVIGVMMSFKCEQVTLGGSTYIQGENRLNISSPCSVDCGCDLSAFQPVCGADGQNYFTPCHAGCDSRVGGNLTGCSCIPGGTARPGLCQSQCDSLIPYGVIIALLSTLRAFIYVSRNIAVLRVSPAGLKSFAMGLNSFLYNALGYLPAPVVYGKLIDNTCLVWQWKCGARGSCSLYNTDSFRYLIHGVAAGLSGLVALLLFIGWRILVKDSSDENKNESGELKETFQRNQEELKDLKRQ